MTPAAKVPIRIPLTATDAGAATAILEALYDCARTTMLEPDGTELTVTLAQALARTFRAQDVVVITIVDEALTASTRLRAGESATPAVLSAGEREFVDWVLQLRQPFASHTLTAMPDSAPKAPWDRVLAVPALHHQGHPVALMIVADAQGGARFGANDLRVLETVAQHASVAFDRALLLAQLDSWAQGLEALFKFSAAVNRERNPAVLVRNMAEHAARLLKADGGRGGLAVPNDAGDDMEMESAAYWHNGTWLEQPRRWRRNVGIPGFLLETEFPYLAADYATDALRDTDADAADVRHAIAVPIKNAEDEVLGFFELHRRDGTVPFSWQDAGFLESVANMTAVAIENARLGAALALKNDEVRALSARHVTRLEQERQHIARELHDEAGQALVGVKLSLQAMGRLVPGEVPALHEQLKHLRAQVNDAATRLKVLARRLRPPTLDRLGLDMALQQLAHESSEHYGFDVQIMMHWLAERLPAETETALFRVTQEALTNVAAHADATAVEIHVSVESGAVGLRISDDGIGFDPEERTPGLGLLGMRERVGMLGGDFRIESAPGAGTTLHISVPLS